jgi:hypothetical protein
MPSTEVLTTAFASVDFEYNEHNCQDVLQQLLEWDAGAIANGPWTQSAVRRYRVI